MRRRSVLLTVAFLVALSLTMGLTLVLADSTTTPAMSRRPATAAAWLPATPRFRLPSMHPRPATLTNTILVSHTVGISAGVGSKVVLNATLWGDDAWANKRNKVANSIINSAAELTGDPRFVAPDVANYRIANRITGRPAPSPSAAIQSGSSMLWTPSTPCSSQTKRKDAWGIYRPPAHLSGRVTDWTKPVART